VARTPRPEPAEGTAAEAARPATPADLARAAVGVHGDTQVPAWSAATTDTSRRRVLSLQLAAAAEWATLVGLILLLPATAADEGWSSTGISTVLLLAGVVYAVSGVYGTGRLVERRVRTVQLLTVNGALVTLLVGFAPGFAITSLLIVARVVLAGLMVASFRTLLYDAVVPEARARAFGRVALGAFLGAAVAAALSATAFGGPEYGADMVLLIVGAFALVLSFATVKLTDPGVGGAEPERLARAFGVDRRLEALRTPMMAAVPRILAVHTFRTSLTANVTAGALSIGLLIPALTAVSWSPLLTGDEPIEGDAIALALAAVLAVTGVVTVLVARGLEKGHRRSLTRLMRSAWLEPLILGGTGVAVLAFVEGPAALLLAALALALIGGAITKVALDVGTLSTVTPVDRPFAVALTNFSWAFGGVLAALVSSWQDDEHPRAGFVVLLALLVVAALINRRIVAQPDADLDATLPIDAEQIIAETPVEPTTGLTPEVSPYAYVAPPAAVLDDAGEPPLLSAEKVSFAYGSVQVLFDVDLVVRPGELVALLGPNGVGKTTLLRCLSGLEIPQQGVVRFNGTDITRSAPSKRVPQGLSQIVGGNAVFGTLSVAENLQMYGYSVTKDRKAVQEGIAQAYDVFPRLADRRSQLGSTLSGGEQQMLGLSKALITKPKLLVIDEFSLGLAPVIVGELLTMVRQLNANGTAVLLVEQSVNVALNLVDRCYFMEKGRVIHEGSAEALRAQPELVQALSLGGLPPELSETTA
jgi:ABC-type branched-subunit amino acid transport system ATPase component